MGRQGNSRLGLTLEIFNELRGSVSDEISTADLLLAAQELVRISKGEYIERVALERQNKPNYYNYELDKAFKTQQGQILCFETTCSEEPVMNEDQKQKLSNLQTQLKDNPWEF